MSRPADTIVKLADYLWWLLPTFMKKKDRAESLVARFTDSWGEQLDEARTTIIAIIPELLAATASGEYLDMLARQRQVFRGTGEDDESLRIRVLAAYIIKRKGGTIPGLIEGLARLGYTVEVLEPFKGTSTWSRFFVRVLGWDGIVSDQHVFYHTIKQLKPAHTLHLVDSSITMGIWDDGGTFDDGGELDDWTNE